MGPLKAMIVGVALTLSGAALAETKAADKKTLADIRQQLTVVHVEIQKLKRELSTTGSASAVASGGSALDRLNGLERELKRLTAKTEKLEYRIGRVVADAGNRIADLEFRLIELEGGDVSKLKHGTTLGGDDKVAAVVKPATPKTGDNVGDKAGDQLAVGEKADFDRAQKALKSGDHKAAAAGFAKFNATYPGSPLAVKAHIGEGLAKEGAGDLTGAARAFLNGFTAAPNGEDAPDALYHLGRGLGRLGQTKEACVTLSEVGVRFPGGSPAAKARLEIKRLGCK